MGIYPFWGIINNRVVYFSSNPLTVLIWKRRRNIFETIGVAFVQRKKQLESPLCFLLYHIHENIYISFFLLSFSSLEYLFLHSTFHDSQTYIHSYIYIWHDTNFLKPKGDPYEMMMTIVTNNRILLGIRKYIRCFVD